MTGGLVNVVPLTHRNQFTKRRWRQRIATPYGAVGYVVVAQPFTTRWEDGAGPVSTPDPHEDLWLYVIHGAREYIGCFRTAQFTPELIAQAAADFACTTAVQ